MECIVCFDEIKNNQIFKCSNTFCTVKTCFECAKTYIKLSNNEKQMPKCVSLSCKAEYLFADIKKLGKESIENYKESCTNYLTSTFGNGLSYTMIIDKCRKERMEFIKKEFPLAITHVISITMNNKLKKVNKNNINYMTKMVKNSNTKCFMATCTGKLDSSFTCLLCESEFCKECHEINEIDHVCKEEDINSVKYIETLVKCPKCLLPVIRSYGCDNITCSICKTNFDYITGKNTVAGNHSNDTLVLKKTNKVSQLYIDLVNKSLIKYFLEIDKLKPPQYNFDDFTEYVMNNKNDSNKLCLYYEKYKISKIQNKFYTQLIRCIDNHIKDKTLDNNTLEYIIDNLKTNLLL